MRWRVPHPSCTPPSWAMAHLPARGGLGFLSSCPEDRASEVLPFGARPGGAPSLSTGSWCLRKLILVSCIDLKWTVWSCRLGNTTWPR